MTEAGKDRTVIDLGSSKVVVTVDDAKAVRAALLERLAQFTSPYRDYLIDMAKLGDIALRERHVDIGRWALQESSGRLVLMHRGPNASTFHSADVTNAAGRWSVKEPKLGEMFLRR
jgi:hypothetical protein